MRVIVNGIPLLSPRSGVGNYVYNTFRAMRAFSEGPDCAFHYGLHWSRELKERPSGFYRGSRRVVRRLGALYPLYRTALDALFAVEHRWGRFDLYHETNYVPMPFGGPTVVTLFDLSFHLHPETHPEGRLRYMERYFYPRFRRARKFITISESVKTELVQHLGIRPEKIAVTPLGVDGSLRPVDADERRGRLTTLGLPSDGYILTVGTLEPRKDVGTLLRAYAGLPTALRKRHPLVVAGGSGWLMDEFDRLVRDLALDGGSVIRAGYVPDEALPALYSGAAAFAFPSVYEGFGLPPLEAMACGAPVVTTNASSLPEVVGDAGLMVPPRDPDALRDALRRLLEDDGLAADLRRRGLARAKRFTWDACAAATAAVYREVLAG